MPGYPVLRHRYNPGNTDSKCDPANRDPQERAESIDERERPGQSRSDGKTHADKTRGVIEQGLAFKNVHQTLGDRYAGSDCGYGNRVRRRNDRGEREGDGDRHLRDHPVDKETNAHDCEYDEAERELQDCSLIAEQTLLGNAPAVQKEKRRQKQQEEDIRLQCNAEIGHGGDDRAKSDLNERQWHWGHARERAADDDRQKKKQGNSNRLHALSRDASGRRESGTYFVSLT